jgi:hypothetical protein
VGPGPDDPDGGGHNGPPPPGGVPPDLQNRVEARIAADLAVLHFAQDVRALRLADPGLVWKYGSENPIADIELVGDRVLVAAGQLTGLDLTTGASQWTKQLRGAGIVAYRGGMLVVAGDQLSIMMLAGNGDRAWQVPLPDTMRYAMPDRLIVDGDTLYVTFHLHPDDTSAVDVVAFALS